MTTTTSPQDYATKHDYPMTRKVVEQDYAKAALLLSKDLACDDGGHSKGRDILAIARCLVTHLGYCNTVGMDADERNNHPATRLYLDKLEEHAKYRGSGKAIAECLVLLDLDD